MSGDGGFFRIFWHVRVAIAVLILELLLQFEIFWIYGKGAVADDRAVADRLDGYQGFRPPAHQPPDPAVLLGLKLLGHALVKQSSASGELNGPFGQERGTSCEREKKGNLEKVLDLGSSSSHCSRLVEDRQDECCRDENCRDLRAEGENKVKYGQAQHNQKVDPIPSPRIVVA